MSSAKQTFAFADYVAFSLTVLASVGIGIYFAFVGRKKNTTLNYFLGDRKLKYGPVALSLVVTFQSSIMLLGFPAEVYLFGYMICLFNIGQCAAIYISTLIVVPLIYPLKITSVFHYLQLRYGRNNVRILSVTIGILSQSIYMGIVLLGPAIALESVTNIPVWASILSIAVAAIIYTSIGGILAVIWTDVLQCAIIIVGILCTLIKGTIDAGGVEAVFRENIKSGRLDIFDFNPDPTIRHTFWTILIGSFIGTFSLSLNQSTIQRFNSTPTIKDAKKVLLIAGPVFITMQMMSMSVGLVCFAYYTVTACDPLTSRRIRNPNQIVPYMIADIFSDYPGLSGIFISALFSASLSTLSSILAGLSAVTIEDLIRPHFKATERILTAVAKVVVVAYGGVGIFIAFILSKLEGSLTQILFSVMGAATGPLVGIFFLSMFFRKATDKGAIIGGITGLLFTFWICIGSTLSRDIPKARPLPFPPTTACIANNYISGVTNISNVNFTYDLPTTQHTDFNITIVTDSMLNVTSTAKMVTRQLKSAEGVDKLYTLSYALFSTAGTLFTVVVGILASLITYKRERDEPDSKYLLPVFSNLCCCFSRLCRSTKREREKNDADVESKKRNSPPPEE